MPAHDELLHRPFGAGAAAVINALVHLVPGVSRERHSTKKIASASLALPHRTSVTWFHLTPLPELWRRFLNKNSTFKLIMSAVFHG